MSDELFEIGGESIFTELFEIGGDSSLTEEFESGGASATGGLSAGGFSLAECVERMNKFLYEVDFVTAQTLTEDITRVATETGLTEEKIQSVMTSTLKIMEERREASGVDPDKIGKGYAIGGYMVWRPGLMRRRR